MREELIGDSGLMMEEREYSWWGTVCVERALPAYLQLWIINYDLVMTYGMTFTVTLITSI